MLSMDSYAEAKIEKMKILEKKIYKNNIKSNIDYEKTLIKNLTFEENLYLQRTDYLNLLKADTEIFLILFFTTSFFSKFIQMSADAKKPFAFIDNNRLLHNRLYYMRLALKMSMNFSSLVFGCFFLYNYNNLYMMKNFFNDEEILEEKIKHNYIDKLYVSKNLHV